MPTLPDEVSKAAQRHLTAADAARPGLIASLYITGSVALGDYQPGRSDDELAQVPDDGRPVTHIVDGEFAADTPCGALTPSTWTEFTRYAIAVRGPQAVELGIAISRARLNEWQLGNLNSYRRDFADHAAKVWSSPS